MTGHRSRVSAAIVAALIACAPVVGVAARAAAPPAEIAVTNDPFPDDVIAAGATFKVEGNNWPADTLIQLEVCGRQARSGSGDCAIGNAQIIASDTSGWFQARLAVVVPPSPCPCVIRAMSQTSAVVATTPVEIPNAPIEHPGDGTVTAPALRRLLVVHARLHGSDSWRTWLGARPERTLEFEVVNTGSVAVSDATVALTVGPADNPTGFVKPVKIEKLEVGESAVFRMTIQFDSLAFGDQVVKATVNGTSVPESFSLTTSTHPWLLIVIPIVLLVQIALLLMRNRLRRRLNPPAEQPTIQASPVLLAIGVGEVASGPELEPEPVPTTAVDECLTFLVVIVEVPAAADNRPSPNPRRSTMMVRSRAELESMLGGPIEVAAGESVDGTAYQGTIDVVTVLANPEATVGAAYAACDELGQWIESGQGQASPAAPGEAVLRRWAYGSSYSAPLHLPGEGTTKPPGLAVLAVFMQVSGRRATTG